MPRATSWTWGRPVPRAGAPFRCRGRGFAVPLFAPGKGLCSESPRTPRAQRRAIVSVDRSRVAWGWMFFCFLERGFDASQRLDAWGGGLLAVPRRTGFLQAQAGFDGRTQEAAGCGDMGH